MAQELMYATAQCGVKDLKISLVHDDLFIMGTFRLNDNEYIIQGYTVDQLVKNINGLLVSMGHIPSEYPNYMLEQEILMLYT